MSEWPMVTCTCRSYNLGTVLFVGTVTRGISNCLDVACLKRGQVLMTIAFMVHSSDCQT